MNKVEQIGLGSDGVQFPKTVIWHANHILLVTDEIVKPYRVSGADFEPLPPIELLFEAPLSKIVFRSLWSIYAGKLILLNEQLNPRAMITHTFGSYLELIDTQTLPFDAFSELICCVGTHAAVLSWPQTLFLYSLIRESGTVFTISLSVLGAMRASPQCPFKDIEVRPGSANGNIIVASVECEESRFLCAIRVNATSWHEIGELREIPGNQHLVFADSVIWVLVDECRSVVCPAGNPTKVMFECNRPNYFFGAAELPTANGLYAPNGLYAIWGDEIYIFKRAAETVICRIKCSAEPIACFPQSLDEFFVVSFSKIERVTKAERNAIAQFSYHILAAV